MKDGRTIRILGEGRLINLAAAEGHPDVVKILIEHGADIKAASKSGWTALVFASVKNDAKSVQMLLAAGADPNYALPDAVKVLVIAASHRSAAAVCSR